MTGVTPPRTAIELTDVWKSFHGVPALRGVDLTIHQGTIHALLGGNGSGKSTLIKTLAGVHAADRGRATVAGATFDLHGQLTPATAADVGLRFVHQDLGLLGDFSIAENFGLAAGYPVRGRRIRWKELHRWTAEVLERFEIDADPHTPVEQLRPATATMVAIARALRDSSPGTGLLVLDEPTASLPDHEVGFLLDALRRRSAAGDTVIYVSHRLREVMAIADHVTVLRNGEAVATGSPTDLGERRLVELIVGHDLQAWEEPADDVTPEVDGQGPGPSGPLLEVSSLRAGPLNGVSFSVVKGEILGVAGLLGAGKSSLLRAFYGDIDAAGDISLDGESIIGRPRRELIDLGIALVPENRGVDAALPDLSVRENLTASVLDDYATWRGWDRASEAGDAGRLCEEFEVKLHCIEQSFASLSGGNQQKVVIARWLRRQPKLLLLDEPTQGVDVGARAEIYGLLRAASARGTTMLVSSSDTDELTTLCSRVIVLRSGKIAADLSAQDATPQRVTELAHTGDPAPRAVSP